MKSRVARTLQAVFFCDDDSARRQSDLTTESDDEIVRVYPAVHVTVQMLARFFGTASILN